MALNTTTALGSSSPPYSETVFAPLFEGRASATATSNSLQEDLPCEIFNIGENLSSHQTEMIRLLLQEFRPGIALSRNKRGYTHLVCYLIDTGERAHATFQSGITVREPSDC